MNGARTSRHLDAAVVGTRPRPLARRADDEPVTVEPGEEDRVVVEADLGHLVEDLHGAGVATGSEVLLEDRPVAGPAARLLELLPRCRGEQVAGGRARPRRPSDGLRG